MIGRLEYTLTLPPPCSTNRDHLRRQNQEDPLMARTYPHGDCKCPLCAGKYFFWGSKNYIETSNNDERPYRLVTPYCFMFRRELSTTPNNYNRFTLIKDRILIPQCFTWDGATWAFRRTLNTFRASLIHDALYEGMRARLLPQNARGWADDELYYMLKADGVEWYRRWLWWTACRLGGWYYTRPGTYPVPAWRWKFL